MQNDKMSEGLTFDDVLLIPAHSNILSPRRQSFYADNPQYFIKHTARQRAAMDTVTESRTRHLHGT